MKDPRWHVRLVTDCRISDHLIDCPLPSDAVGIVFDEIGSDEQFVSITVTENAVYRRQRERELAREYNDIRDAAPEMVKDFDYEDFDARR